MIKRNNKYCVGRYLKPKDFNENFVKSLNNVENKDNYCKRVYFVHVVDCVRQEPFYTVVRPVDGCDISFYITSTSALPYPDVIREISG